MRSSTIIWSDELRRILGIGPEVEPSVEAYLSAIHPEDRDRMRVAAKKVLAGQFEGPTTFRVLRGDGEVRWIHRVNEMVRDGRGMPISIITTIIDVTEARRSEEERTRLQEQLAHAQKLESLGALSGGIAHDFNNLLTSIMGSAALLRDDPTLSPAARELTEIVIKASEQGAELTRRLLSFGRRQMLKPVVIDLAMVARELDHSAAHAGRKSFDRDPSRRRPVDGEGRPQPVRIRRSSISRSMRATPCPMAASWRSR